MCGRGNPYLDLYLAHGTQYRGPLITPPLRTPSGLHARSGWKCPPISSGLGPLRVFRMEVMSTQPGAKKIFADVSMFELSHNGLFPCIISYNVLYTNLLSYVIIHSDVHTD